MCVFHSSSAVMPLACPHSAARHFHFVCVAAQLPLVVAIDLYEPFYCTHPSSTNSSKRLTAAAGAYTPSQQQQLPSSSNSDHTPHHISSPGHCARAAQCQLLPELHNLMHMYTMTDLQNANTLHLGLRRSTLIAISACWACWLYAVCVTNNNCALIALLTHMHVPVVT
jgi:hypothetical protein